MCGIAGFLESPGGRPASEMSGIAQDMAHTLYKRGPDDSGVWVDSPQGIALSHRRLSIIDLSAAGHQPMTSSCGGFSLVYNGEVYNSEQIRAELRAAGRRDFRGYSDTEVILEGIAQWGLVPLLERLVGMFAFAVWDHRQERLSLVRDRLGVKPLYWSTQGQRLMFASELKALCAHPDWIGEHNGDALAAFLRYAYIPGPHSVYRNTHKLQPGCMLTVDKCQPDKPQITQYWSLEKVAERGRLAPFHGSSAEMLDTLEEQLSEAVACRMVADVPLGAFLSGGVDSSIVAAMMQRNASAPVKTFSVDFGESGYSEAGHAAAVASHLGTDHTELLVTPQQAMEVIPDLPEMYDEPFADSSQIPTYLISALTRKHVTVALSGDGGDEVFAGYNRYARGMQVHRALTKLPLWMRNGGAQLVCAFSPGFWDTLFSAVPSSIRPSLAGDKMHKLATVVAADDETFYRNLVSHWDAPEALIAGSREAAGMLWNSPGVAAAGGVVERMRYIDTCTYLPDDILTKVDRASMAASLEARVPLLDHRLVEFAWRIPTSELIKNGQGKWPLRQVLYRHVPQALVDRPKMGFAIPLEDWLRGPLRDWAESLLSTPSLESYGILSPEPVRLKWQEHLSGKRNWQYLLWDVLMLQAWCRKTF